MVWGDLSAAVRGTIDVSAMNGLKESATTKGRERYLPASLPEPSSVMVHPQNVQLLNVQLLHVQLPNIQLPKVLITKRPDYQTSSYQRSRLPNIQFTKRPVT